MAWSRPMRGGWLRPTGQISAQGRPLYTLHTVFDTQARSAVSQTRGRTWRP